MLVTVFIFSFAWEWTDDFYTSIFFETGYFDEAGSLKFMSSITGVPDSLKVEVRNLEAYASAITGTATILIALPLILAYLFVQNYIVQGIERSGIVG